MLLCVCMCMHVCACVCMCVHVCACVCMCVHVCACGLVQLLWAVVPGVVKAVNAPGVDSRVAQKFFGDLFVCVQCLAHCPELSCEFLGEGTQTPCSAFDTPATLSRRGALAAFSSEATGVAGIGGKGMKDLLCASQPTWRDRCGLVAALQELSEKVAADVRLVAVMGALQQHQRLVAGRPSGAPEAHWFPVQCGMAMSETVMAPGGVLALLDVTVAAAQDGDLTDAAASLAGVLCQVPLELVSSDFYVCGARDCGCFPACPLRELAWLSANSLNGIGVFGAGFAWRSTSMWDPRCWNC
jgi:hypothetical protein